MMKCIIRIIFPLLLMAPVAWAGSRIVAVRFEGLVSVTESVASSRIESRAGTTYSAGRVSADIKQLYKSGLFSDVRASKESTPGGVSLVFHVTENRTVGKLTVTGNKKLDDDEVRGALKLNEGDLLDEARIAESRREIYRLYEEKGLYLADIRTRVEPFDEGTGEVELVFDIEENRPVRIRRIRFIGNRRFSDAKLRRKMKTKEKGLLSFITSSGKYQSEKLDVDLQRLRMFYLDNGFLRVKVDDPNVTLTRDKRSIYITIPVREGRRFKVESVGVAGDVLTTEQELRSKLSLKPGEIYRKTIEIRDVQELERLYGDQAYAFANVVPQVEPDDARRRASVTYFIEKGPKIKVNRIVIRGNRVTRDKVIRRELRIYENSFYTQSGLEMSQTRLQHLGYFDEVNVSRPRGAGENTVDVVFEVKERENTGSFSVGAGFSTLETFVFTANIQKENFFGRGWSGGVAANLSKLRQNVMIQFSDNYFLDTRWQFGFTLIRYHSALNRFFDEDRFGGSVRFGREVFDFFNLSAGYQVEDVGVDNFAAQVPAYFQSRASGLTSGLTGQASYDRRDNRLITTKGMYAAGTVDYSDKYFGATNRYVRYGGDARVFFSLPWHFVLKGRGYFGYINSLSTQPVGLFDRFFLGGVNSLRGYEINSVGPTLTVPSTPTGGDTSFTYGGTRSLMFNAELEIPIYAPAGFQAVAFFDSGNAYGETEDIDFARLRSDYGFGLRWQSPFGPLRFEWGFPINRRPFESAAVFNFTIGQSF